MKWILRILVLLILLAAAAFAIGYMLPAQHTLTRTIVLKQAPDGVFADAWTVGLGPDLELATLASAITAARRLPSGTWLDLNISPRLPGSAPRLREVIRAADRPVVRLAAQLMHRDLANKGQRGDGPVRARKSRPLDIGARQSDRTHG
jgi:hypothetical protein